MVSTQSDNGLTQQQEEAIVALLNETTVQRASSVTGVPHRTLYNWLSDPTFRSEYLRRRREAFGQAVALTQRYAPLAVNTLAKILNDETAPHSARVSAARTLLDFGREGLELDDLAARVDALENPAKSGTVNLDLMPPRLNRYSPDNGTPS